MPSEPTVATPACPAAVAAEPAAEATGLSAPPAVDDLPAAAAILDDGSVDADALLAGIVQDLRDEGRQVHGLLMTYPEGRSTCAGPMVLRDIRSDAAYLVSQDLGPGSTGCRADAAGFARASEVLRRALAAAPDVAVSNRFGGLEAEGGGFSSELLALMAQGVPVLTVVATRHVGAWQRFTGGAPLLPADAAAVRGWLAQVLPPAAGASAAPSAAPCVT